MTDPEFAGFIATCAHKALLYEALTAPKPGLVDRFDAGAHRDMDIFTFVDSAEALLPFFYRCAAAGIGHGKADETLFARLRRYGLDAEKDMFAATGGVNTHKGALFSMGLICAAAGIAGEGADFRTVCVTAGELAAPLADDLRRIDPADATYGERHYLRTGRAGIRDEALSGFRTVRELAVPALRESLKEGMSINDAALTVLLRLIAETEDTTLLKRCGDRDADRYRREAAAVPDCRGEAGKRELVRLNREWSAAGISAGGCADLLGVTLFFAFFNKYI